MINCLYIIPCELKMTIIDRGEKNMSLKGTVVNCKFTLEGTDEAKL